MTLSPTALVQRWDGAQWVDVTEVAVGERDADLGAEWGSPAVAGARGGSYRVSRGSAWGVFTVTAS